MTAPTLPPATRRVADQIARGARLSSHPEAVAAIICSTGEIAAGLAALSALEQLRARHTKRSWGDLVPGPQAVVVVCAACNVAWPCTDAEILGME